MSAVGRGKLESFERVQVSDRDELRAWLQEHHLTAPGVWLRMYRRGTGMPRPGIDEIVEELLCFGWIDSTMRKLDEMQTELLCTPRRPGSHWAKSNRERVERLTALGRMMPRGLEVVAIARADGSFDSLRDVENLIEPSDFRLLLEASATARQYWDACPPSYRRMMLHWVQAAKRPATRQSRIEAVVTSASTGRRVQESASSPPGK